MNIISILKQELGGLGLDTFFRKFKKEKELNSAEKARVYYRDGKFFMEQQDFEKAIERFAEAIKMDPSMADAHDYLGRCYMEEHINEKAADCMRTALELEPERLETHYQLGVLYIRMKKVKEAIEQFEEEIRLNPRYGAAHNNLAVAYYSMKNTTMALQHYELAKKSGTYIQPEFEAAMKKMLSR